MGAVWYGVGCVDGVTDDTNVDASCTHPPPSRIYPPQVFVKRMEHAAEEDERASKEGRPCMRKYMMLQEVMGGDGWDGMDSSH